MSTILAMESHKHMDVAPLPTHDCKVHTCFGGQGRFSCSQEDESIPGTVVCCDGPYGDTVQAYKASLGMRYRLFDIPVVSRKNYRFSLWVKRIPYSPMASVHHVCVLFGIDGRKVTTLDGNAVENGLATNWSLNTPFDDWFLMVIYLHSHRSFRSLSNGGCFHPSGHLLMSFSDYKQKMGTRFQSLEFSIAAKQYQNPDSQSALFFYPRVDEITGNEVSIAELLNGYGYNLFVKEFDFDESEYSNDENASENEACSSLNESCFDGIPTDTLNDCSKQITNQERYQLNVALDKLCEIDSFIERYGMDDRVDGEVSPIPDTIVKRSNNAEIFATIMRAELVEAEHLVSTSDRRLKSDIQKEDLGLAFIELLRPVSYKKMKLYFSDEMPEGKHLTDTNLEDGSSKLSDNCEHEYFEERQSGLIAQEVESALKLLGKEWSGHRVNANGIQGLQYAQLTLPLINAVKELSHRNRLLEKKVQSLEYRMNSMVRGLIGSA